MPVLDGFAATREIRTLEKNGIIRGELHIIALTADISEENQKRCFSAGMNSFLGKPVKLQGIPTCALFVLSAYCWIRHPKSSGEVVALKMNQTHIFCSRTQFCYVFCPSSS